MALIYGTNPVLETLNTQPEKIDEIAVLKGPLKGQLGRIARICRDRQIRIVFFDKKTLNRKANTTSHQGVIAYLSDFEYATVKEIISTESKPARIVVLDGVQDPHNLGAIVRTCVCAGVDGIIIPERNAVGVTPAVVKTSAGATRIAKIARVRNIANTIDLLKESGFWTVAIEADGEMPVQKIDTKENLVYVFGNEGKGLRPLVRKKCDLSAHIPMKGNFDSLNVSVSVGIVLFTS